MLQLPFSFVEDPTCQIFVWGINPKVKSVTKNTMRNDYIKVYEDQKIKLQGIPSESRSRVCLTLDIWTSKQELPSLALTAHFIDKISSCNKGQ